jgi:ribosome-binding protein aMBF1 (putative translation factor)
MKCAKIAHWWSYLTIRVQYSHTMQKTIYTHEHEIFARRLRAARLAAGLKQTELAERLGKPHSYISRIETSQIRVDVIELRTICSAMGVSFRNFVNQLEDELTEADAEPEVRLPSP